MIEKLEPVAPMIGEGEEGSAFGILLESFLGESVETVEGLAHVAGFDGEVNSQAAG
jgi:hypothetical protein